MVQFAILGVLSSGSASFKPLPSLHHAHHAGQSRAGSLPLTGSSGKPTTMPCPPPSAIAQRQSTKRTPPPVRAGLSGSGAPSIGNRQSQIDKTNSPAGSHPGRTGGGSPPPHPRPPLPSVAPLTNRQNELPGREGQRVAPSRRTVSHCSHQQPPLGNRQNELPSPGKDRESSASRSLPPLSAFIVRRLALRQFARATTW